MKDRILKGWNLLRIFYLGIGLFIMIQSVITGAYFGLLFGAYFASMGLFKFGCAAGNCKIEKSNRATLSINEKKF